MEQKETEKFGEKIYNKKKRQTTMTLKIKIENNAGKNTTHRRKSNINT